jgi:glutamyl-tRNA reductase
LRPHLYERSGRSAVEHLFNVAASLDSMVLGETQILGQVRQAYDTSREIGATGPILNPLFQRASRCWQRGSDPHQPFRRPAQRRERRRRLCTRHLRSLRRQNHPLHRRRQDDSLVMQHLAALKPGRLLICNRDPLKAIALAQRHGGEGFTDG